MNEVEWALVRSDDPSALSADERVQFVETIQTTCLDMDYLNRVKALVDEYCAGGHDLTALELYYALERCTPLWLFHQLLRRGRANMYRSLVQQSYADHNRLLAIGLDMLAARDVAWYVGRGREGETIDTEALKTWIDGFGDLRLGRTQWAALWIAAALHDYGKIYRRRDPLDAEEACDLAGPVLDILCDSSRRRLVEYAIRNHDLVEHIWTGEIAPRFVSEQILQVSEHDRRWALPFVAAIQLAGAASLGDGRVTTEKIVFVTDACSGELMAETSIDTRLARLLFGSSRKVLQENRQRAQQLLSRSTGTTNEAVSELLRTAILHKWRNVSADWTERWKLLTSSADVWFARGASHLHIVFDVEPTTAGELCAGEASLLNGAKALLLSNR